MPSPRISSKLKAAIAQRAKFCCEYCLSQETYSPTPFSVDHIIPLIEGGSNKSSNLAFSCQGCNNRKFTSTQAFDSANQVMVPLFNPREQAWNKHFAWNADCQEMIGLTATGRATIEKLQLNRSGLVNLREVLRSAGKHPPSL